jgi:hypothetical protein
MTLGQSDLGQSEDDAWSVEGCVHLLERVLSPLSPLARSEWMVLHAPLTSTMLGISQPWLVATDLPDGHAGGGRVHRFEHQAP